MKVFQCERYPQLQVRTKAGTVRFADGRAEATTEQAKVLRGLSEEYGITEAAAEGGRRGADPKTPTPPPVPGSSGGE